jgi:hypothetical protein
MDQTSDRVAVARGVVIRRVRRETRMMMMMMMMMMAVSFDTWSAHAKRSRLGSWKLAGSDAVMYAAVACDAAI